MEKIEKLASKILGKSAEKAPEKTEKGMTESKEELPSNVKVVETDKGKFRIAYGLHITERKADEFGNPDAWAPEAANLDYSLPKELTEKEFNDFFKTDKSLTEYLKSSELGYEKLVEKAKKRKTPIFLTDISGYNAAAVLQIGLKFLEPTVGTTLLLSLKKDLQNFATEEKKLSRREFIKKGAKAVAKGVVGTYFLSELATLLEFGRVAGDLNERIHPETNAIILTLRNHLLAQKAETVAEKLKIKNRKPEITITTGTAHHGIEKALLRQDEERIKLIGKLLSVLPKDAREKIATIARFDYNEDKDLWEMTDRFKDELLAGIKK